MACLTFSRALSSYALPTCCLDRYLAEQSTLHSLATDPLISHLLTAMTAASMSGFAKEMCGCEGEGSAVLLQIALYAQGIHYHSSDERK